MRPEEVDEVLAALAAGGGVGHQTGDVWPHGRQVFDELLARSYIGHRSAAVRTIIQRHFDAIVYFGRFLTISRRMTLFASWLLVVSGRLAIVVFATERRCLSSRLA